MTEPNNQPTQENTDGPGAYDDDTIDAWLRDAQQAVSEAFGHAFTTGDPRAGELEELCSDLSHRINTQIQPLRREASV